MAAVLKTARGSRSSRVRIPRPPPLTCGFAVARRHAPVWQTARRSHLGHIGVLAAFADLARTRCWSYSLVSAAHRTARFPAPQGRLRRRFAAGLAGSSPAGPWPTQDGLTGRAFRPALGARGPHLRHESSSPALHARVRRLSGYRLGTPQRTRPRPPGAARPMRLLAASGSRTCPSAARSPPPRGADARRNTRRATVRPAAHVRCRLQRVRHPCGAHMRMSMCRRRRLPSDTVRADRAGRFSMDGDFECTSG